MRKTAILLVLTLLLAACAADNITTVNEAYAEVQRLDEEYNTSFQEEKLNTMTLDQAEMKSYLDDLEELRKKVKAKNEDQEEWIRWFFDAREQMLKSQLYFQQAWLNIGEIGRVADGFSCSEYPYIKNSTALMEKSLLLGRNATGVFDSLMTENKEMQEKIGIGDDRPAFYDSRFEEVYVHIQSNVVAMVEFCDKTVPTEELNFTERIKEVEVNESEYVR